jgi:hypothetical protein
MRRIAGGKRPVPGIYTAIGGGGKVFKDSRFIKTYTGKKVARKEARIDQYVCCSGVFA